jgi:hypothetical protein
MRFLEDASSRGVPDLGLSKINQQAASLAGSMPKLNIVNIAGPAFPASVRKPILV